MKLGDTQPFASPEEAVGYIEHHGVKGMRWGVRKEEETSSRPSANRMKTPGRDVARSNEQAKSHVMKNLVTDSDFFNPPGSSSGKATTKKQDSGTAEKKDSEKHGGLTPNQKKALLVAGVGVVAVGGYFAYRHYAAGRIPPEFDLAKGPLSTAKVGGLGHGHPAFELKNPDKLMVDISKGYADIRPIDGFSSAAVKERHDELARTFEELRRRYPAVANMNVELVPMSEAPGLENFIDQVCPAAVQSIKKGEARIYYNDILPELTGEQADSMKNWVAGYGLKDYIGNHEMGHVLAAAHGELPPSFGIMSSMHDAANADDSSLGVAAKQVRLGLQFNRDKNKGHKDAFKRHGLSFKELSEISPYAGTQPAEALAELAGSYFTPHLREKMSPELQSKAKSLFDELGGVT